MITSVMYHYVRPIENSQLRYLSVNDFEQQLNWLQTNLGNIITQDQWDAARLGEPITGVLLTFDDGLKDHINFVLPILKAKGFFGIFFVNTSPLESSCVLPVHLTHVLLSLDKTDEILDFFTKFIPPQVFEAADREIAATRYKNQHDFEANIELKRLVNYLFMDIDLTALLDLAAQKFLSVSISELSSSWYLSKEDVIELRDSGMRIGSHTSTHRLLSKLDKSTIFAELDESKRVLEKVLGEQIDEFCYPYGGWTSYNQDVKDVLAKLNFAVAHDVSPRPITQIDFRNKYELPRYDCNSFPFGTAWSLKDLI